MLSIENIVPPGYTSIVPNPTDKLQKIMPYLLDENKVGVKWTLIPDTEIEVFFQLTAQIPLLAFRKNKKEAYIHVLGLESYNLANPFTMVRALYKKFNLGIPKKPGEPNWIHTIPLEGSNLSAEEVMLIHQITKSFFGTLHMDFKSNVLKK
jgi:hypothetical protein